MHQGPGTEQGSHPIPREQADTGAAGLLHRGELEDLYGEQGLWRWCRTSCRPVGFPWLSGFPDTNLTELHSCLSVPGSSLPTPGEERRYSEYPRSSGFGGVIPPLSGGKGALEFRRGGPFGKQGRGILASVTSFVSLASSLEYGKGYSLEWLFIPSLFYPQALLDRVCSPPGLSSCVCREEGMSD